MCWSTLSTILLTNKWKLDLQSMYVALPILSENVHMPKSVSKTAWRVLVKVICT